MKFNAENDQFEFSGREAHILGLSIGRGSELAALPRTDAMVLARRALELEAAADTSMYDGTNRVAVYAVALATYQGVLPYATGVHALDSGFDIESMRVSSNAVRPTIPGKTT